VPVIPNFSSFLSRMSCGTVSNAFFKSRKMPMQYLFSFSAVEMVLITCRSACSVDLCFWKPYWCLYMSWCVSRCRVSLLYTNLSSILEKAFTRVIGL
jgi:hypothetical protein